jgi:hypothetical protein
MRSKEAFAYSRSTGYFCSVAADHPAPAAPNDAVTGLNLSRRNRQRAGHRSRNIFVSVGIRNSIIRQHDSIGCLRAAYRFGLKARRNEPGREGY